MKTFTASRIADGQGLFPCKIIVGANKITVKIPGLFSNQDKDIPFDKISEVSVDTPLVGYSTIRFYTTGVGIVSAHGFTKSEVKEIKQLIDNPAFESSHTQSSSVETSEPYEPVSTGKISYSSSISEDEWDNLRPTPQTDKIENGDTSIVKNESAENNSFANNAEAPKREISSLLSERFNQRKNKHEEEERKNELINEIKEFRTRLEVFDSEYRENPDNPPFLVGLKNLLDFHSGDLEVIAKDYSDVMDKDLEKEIIHLLDVFDNLLDEVSRKNKIDQYDTDELNKICYRNYLEKLPLVKELYQVSQSTPKNKVERIQFYCKLAVNFDSLGMPRTKNVKVISGYQKKLSSEQMEELYRLRELLA